MRNSFILLVLLVVFFLPNQIYSGQKKDIDSFQLRFHECLNQIIRKCDLKNKVVVVLLWSSECNNCKAKLSTFKKYHKNYSDKGLLIVGGHKKKFDKINVNLTNKEVEQLVEKFLKKNKIYFPNFIYGTTLGVKITKESVSMPYIFVYNQEGKKLYEGDGVYKALKMAVKLLEETNYIIGKKNIKYLKKEEKYIKDFKLGYAYKFLEKKKDSKNPKEKEEAAFLLAKLGEYLAKQKELINYVKLKDPRYAKGYFEKLIKAFKYSSAETAIKEEYKKFKKSKAYKAASIYEKYIEGLLINFRPAKYGMPVDLSDSKCRKKNGSKIYTLKKYCVYFIKNYPSSVYVAKVKKILKSLE